MSRKKFVYKQKIIKISEPQQANLDEIMNTGRFVSEAEVFREGLELLFRKIDPKPLVSISTGPQTIMPAEQETT